MSLLRWSLEERGKVMAEFHRLKNCKADTDMNLLKLAQQVLHESRRYAAINPQFVYGWMKRYTKALEYNTIKEPTLAASTKEPPEIVKVEVPVYITKEPDYGVIPTVQLARLLLQRLADMEESEKKVMALQDFFQKKHDAEINYNRHLDTRPAAEQPALPPLRIVLIGPLDSQMREIETRCASISRPLKLRCYDKEHEGQDLDGIMDYVIITRHVHHAWEEKARKELPRDRVLFIDGGINSVVQKIYDLASKQTPGLNGLAGPVRAVPALRT